METIINTIEALISEWHWAYNYGGDDASIIKGEEERSQINALVAKAGLTQAQVDAMFERIHGCECPAVVRLFGI